MEIVFVDRLNFGVPAFDCVGVLCSGRACMTSRTENRLKRIVRLVVTRIMKMKTVHRVVQIKHQGEQTGRMLMKVTVTVIPRISMVIGTFIACRRQ